MRQRIVDRPRQPLIEVPPEPARLLAIALMKVDGLQQQDRAVHKQSKVAAIRFLQKLPTGRRFNENLSATSKPKSTGRSSMPAV